MQRATNTVFLFGRQVGPMKTQSPKFHKSKLDLQLPTDQYIYQINQDFPGKLNLWGHFQETTDPRNSYDLCHLRNEVELELSLGNGSKTKTWEVLMGNWPCWKPLQTVINLEEPTGLTSSIKKTEPCLGRKLSSEVFLSSDHTNSKFVKPYQSFSDDEKRCNKQGFFNQGLKGRYDSKPCSSPSSSKQQLISCSPGILDLNKVPLDEPVLDLEGCFLHDLNHPYTEDEQVSCENSEVEDPTPFGSTQSKSIQEKDGTRSTASYSSCSIRDGDDSRTESRVSSPHSLDQISHTHVESQIIKTLSSDTKEGSCDKKEGSSEIDPLVQMAAESLVHISFSCSAQSCDVSPEPGSCYAETECSLDSYELLTLNITETNPDDYCVSSEPPVEPNRVENNKNSGFKLRRGRRMKNFQKEILPGLMSLTRHEIREDVNILEAVLRSREYRKNRGKRGERDWCAPVKTKRSRTRYVGRRS